MNYGPAITRPSYVSLIPGGPQEFPDDPKGEAYRTQVSRDEYGKGTVRRIPKDG